MTKLLFLLVPLGLCMWMLLFMAIFSIGQRAVSHEPVMAMFRGPHNGSIIRVTDRF